MRGSNFFNNEYLIMLLVFALSDLTNFLLAIMEDCCNSLIMIRIFRFAGAPSSIRNAFLEDQDISHDPSGPIGLQTIDQQDEAHLHATALSLEPPLDEEDYLFTLQNTEGITDLFDVTPFNV